MSLQYVIDGYNLIHHPQFGRRAPKAADPRQALIALIWREALTGSVKNAVCVVFDGYPDAASPACRQGDGARMLFSHEESADAVIMRLVENAPHAKTMVVVSDDRQIRIHAKAYGAKAVGVDEFLGAPKAMKKDEAEAELNYSQKAKIDEELKKLWLK